MAEQVLMPLKLSLVELDRATGFTEDGESGAEAEIRICFAAREAYQTFIDAVCLSARYKERDRSTLQAKLEAALAKVSENDGIRRSIQEKIDNLRADALQRLIDKL